MTSNMPVTFTYHTSAAGKRKIGTNTAIATIMLDFPYQRVPISATYARIASKAPVFSFTARGWLEEPNG